MKKAAYIFILLCGIVYGAENSAVSFEEDGIDSARTTPPQIPAFPEERPRSTPRDPEQPRRPVAVPPQMPRPDAGPPAAPRPAPDSADWILRRMAASDDADLRRRAAEAWPLSEEALSDMNALAQALADPDPQLRANAIQRLTSVEPGLLFGYVMRTLTGGTIDRVRTLDAALPALGSILGQFMHETLRTELETPMHRRIAAYCLGRMAVEEAAHTLAQYAWNADTVLARSCVDALYALASERSVPAWASLLEHPDDYFQQQAVRALARSGNPQAVQQLREIALGARGLHLQSEALRAMDDYPPEILFPLLVEAMERSAQIRPVALRILRKRSGMDFGAYPPAWRRWLNELISGPSPPPLLPGR